MASTLGTLIRDRRKQARLKQIELAERLGVTRETVSALENGRIDQPTVETINKLASILPVSTVEIVKAMGIVLDEQTRFTSVVIGIENRVARLQEEMQRELESLRHLRDEQSGTQHREN